MQLSHVAANELEALDSTSNRQLAAYIETVVGKKFRILAQPRAFSDACKGLQDPVEQSSHGDTEKIGYRVTEDAAEDRRRHQESPTVRGSEAGGRWGAEQARIRGHNHDGA